MAQTALLDKIINLKLIKKDGTFDEIKCPATGQKPMIQLQGKMIADMVNDIELRITNFYPSSDLTTYKTIEITTGYSGSLQTSLIGSVWIAYQDSPGPDGVTYFQLLLGNHVDFMNKDFDESYQIGDNYAGILQKIAYDLGLKFSPNQDVMNLPNLAAPLSFSGKIKDAIGLLRREALQSFVVRMESTELLCYLLRGNTRTVHDIDFFTSPPKKEAYGWTFITPWQPDIRPGDQIRVNPKYFKQSYATYQASAFTPTTGATAQQSLFTVMTIDFNFVTVGASNSMTVVALDGSEQAKS